MRFRHEDAAVGRDQHIVRLGEIRRRIAGLARRAERHQQLALRAELEDGVALALGVRELCHLGGRRRSRVHDPHVALPIDVHAVRPEDLSGAEALDDLAARIELDDRFDVRPGAELVPAVAGPDVLAVDVDVDRADRFPLRPSGSVPQFRTVS